MDSFEGRTIGDNLHGVRTTCEGAEPGFAALAVIQLDLREAFERSIALISVIFRVTAEWETR